MMEQQSTWARGRAARRPRRRTWSLTRPHLRIRPAEWGAGLQVSVGMALLCLAFLLYSLQVGNGSWLQFNLSNASVKQTQLNAHRALLLAERDKLLSAYRIGNVAANQLHLEHPSLDQALWLRVVVPAGIPRDPKEPRVQTGPLVWMENVVTTVRNSL